MPIGMSDASDHQIASSPCAQSDVDRAVRPRHAHNIGADLTDADRLNSIPTDPPGCDRRRWLDGVPHQRRLRVLAASAHFSGDHHDLKPEEIVEAEIVEPEGDPDNDTPQRIAEMIKLGAFDRKASE
jgi:hypothetical protein